MAFFGLHRTFALPDTAIFVLLATNFIFEEIIMNNAKELTLKIEDLEERIAPHIAVALPGVSEVPNDQVVIGTEGGVHGSVGPEADPFVTPHR